MSIAHQTSENVQIGEYFIPKDTVAYVNMYAVHMNPTTYPQPEVFKPDRWIDPEGKIIKREEFIPFSIGKKHLSLHQLSFKPMPHFRRKSPDFHFHYTVKNNTKILNHVNEPESTVLL